MPVRGRDQPSLFGTGVPALPAARPPARPARPEGVRSLAPAHEAVLALDIETCPDGDLMPADWPPDKFPKVAWHRVTCISFVVAGIARGPGGTETYRVEDCRSGGEAGWDERSLLRAFWRFFGRRRYRVVTWNGRAFDMPVLVTRSMMHGIDASAWFRAGTRWEGYRHRYAADWHLDLMDAMSDHGATSRLTLEEAARMIGLPGKMCEHGSEVAAMVAAGDISRVRDYCETDTLNLVALFFRWALLTGRTDVVGHDAAVAGLMDYLDLGRDGRPHLGRFVDEWRSSAVRRPALVGYPDCNGSSLRRLREGRADDQDD